MHFTCANFYTACLTASDVSLNWWPASTQCFHSWTLDASTHSEITQISLQSHLSILPTSNGEHFLAILKFHNKSASSTDKDVGGRRARSNRNKLPRKTSLEDQEEGWDFWRLTFKGGICWNKIGSQQISLSIFKCLRRFFNVVFYVELNRQR